MLGRPSNDPQLMTYRSYLDSFLLPFRVGSDPETQRYNSHAKHERQSYKRKFTEPGQPGEMFRQGSSCYPPVLPEHTCQCLVCHVCHNCFNCKHEHLWPLELGELSHLPWVFEPLPLAETAAGKCRNKFYSSTCQLQLANCRHICLTV